MHRVRTRNRTLFAGLAVTLAVTGLGLYRSPADATVGQTQLANAQRMVPVIDAYTAAAKTCDLDATREAYETMESTWNSVEIYLQFMSVERYNFFEHTYLENRVEDGTGLNGGGPDTCANLSLFGDDMKVTWAEVLDFFKNSPAPCPVFDDVATLRTVNQGIRRARTAIDGYPLAVPASAMTAPDPAGAKKWWDGFVTDYPAARKLIAFRNPALATEVDGLVANVTAAFGAANAPTNYPGASAALAALAPRFNQGATLATAAGRGFIGVRKTFDPAATATQGTVGDILAALHDMRYHVSLGTLAGATTAQATYTTAVQQALSFKTGGPLTHADAALTAAVNNYVAAQTPASAKALRDQIDAAEQIFVGQSWGTKPLVDFLSRL